MLPFNIYGLYKTKFILQNNPIFSRIIQYSIGAAHDTAENCDIQLEQPMIHGELRYSIGAAHNTVEQWMILLEDYDGLKKLETAPSGN